MPFTHTHHKQNTHMHTHTVVYFPPTVKESYRHLTVLKKDRVIKH